MCLYIIVIVMSRREKVNHIFIRERFISIVLCDCAAQDRGLLECKPARKQPDSSKGESCSKMAAPDAKGFGEIRIFETLDDLTTDLVEHIAQLSEASVRERGFFTIALTGGSLISLISKLSENPYNKTVDWAKWHVFWADERAVSKNRPDSNYKLVRDEFLSKVPVHYGHVYSFNDKLMVDKAARDYEFKIRQLVKVRTIDVSKWNDCPKFDLVLLEVGGDGHVASLFPRSTTLDNKEDWVTYIHDSPEGPPERITFTLPVINSASNVALVAIGDDKVMAVDGAIRSSTEGPDASVPATMVKPSEGKLVWFVDALAATPHVKRTMNLRFA